MESKLSQMMSEAMGQIKHMIDVNTVVGEPITTPDGTTIIPVSKISFGSGSGGSDWGANFGGGAGIGATVTPVAFLVVTQSGVKLLPVEPGERGTLEKIVDAVPSLVEKAEELIAKYKK